MSDFFLRTAAIWLVAWLCLGAGEVQALDRQRSFSQLHHTRWTATDGAPTGIRKISQTTDGWLWLGSTSGLYRFDGVRFERFSPPEDPDFGARPVSTLAATADGDLWVGLLDGGIARVDPHGRLITYPLPADLPAFQTAKLAATGHQAWATVAGQLLFFDGQSWRHPEARFQTPDTPPAGLHTDANGDLWLASADRWFWLNPARQQFEEKVRGLSEGRAIRIVDGRSWVVTVDGIHPLPGSQRRGPGQARQRDSSAVWIDGQSNVWSAYCPAGVCRMRLPASWSASGESIRLPPVDDTWTRRDGLSSDIGMTVLEDREGNLWVATQTGLDRFRDTLLARLSPSSAATNYLLQPYRLPDPDGPMRQHLLLSAMDATHGSMLWRWSEASGFSPIPWPKDHGRIRALHRDAEGLEWVGSTTGLWQLQNGQARPIPPPPGAQAAPYCRQLLSSRRGLWALFPSQGLRLRRDGAWQALPFSGLDQERPTAFALEGDTAVWTGYATDRVMRSDERGHQTYDAASGLAVGAVNYVFSGRHVLVGGDRGVQMLVGDRFRTLRASDPEALRGITGAVETLHGDLWLNGIRGAVQVKAESLTRALEDPQAELSVQVFDAGDGYPSGATALGPQSSVVASGPGRLWFAGLEGLAALDLDRLPPPRPGPMVQWLAVAADQRWQPAEEGLTLPAGTQTVSVRFTALELGSPEALRFEARLDGVDADWRPLGSQRELSYSHLPPGRHRLQVRASLAQGPASTSPATLHFVLAPTLSQTLWVQAAEVLAGVALLAFAVRWRTRQLARREHELLRIRMDEREQLAQQLNDTLLQGLHGLTLHFQKVANRMPADDPNLALMDTALNRADELILRGREQVSELCEGLRREDPDLGVALSQHGERLAAAHTVAFLMEVDGAPRPLRVSVSGPLRLLGQEILDYAFSAAGARQVHTRLVYRWWGLRLTVTLNGQLFAPDGEATAHIATRALLRMQERSRRLGARLRMATTSPTATQVTVRLWARRAYAGIRRLSEDAASQSGRFRNPGERA